MRILVCGGRLFGYIPPHASEGRWGEWRERVRRAERERQLLEDTLTGLDPAPTCVIHGDCSGADHLAKAWAVHNAVQHMPFPISNEDWARWGKAAGPKRNARMLEQGQPDLVLAFPGGRGTENMVRLARGAGIPVRIVALEQADVAESGMVEPV